MVPKKNKSNRQTASMKYKIVKKVADAKRKARRNAKKNPDTRKKIRKDPGIPRLFPGREAVLAEMEKRKEEDKAEKEEARLQRIQNRTDRRAGNNLTALAQNAQARGSAFEVSQDQDEVDAANHNSDSSRRAYYKDFKKVIEAADVILEVLDARDPMGCRAPQVEEMIHAAGADKKIVLVLNKIDLVPKANAEAWLKYFRNEYPAIAFKASTQSQKSNIGRSKVDSSKASEDLLNSQECLGADQLVKLLKNYCRNVDIKTSISVGIIGYPNVGKSSIINSLKRSRACGVGNTPGFTKSIQQINLDKNIKLLDTPGIVFSASTSTAEVALRNCVKVEQIEDPMLPVESLVTKCTPAKLMELYSVPRFETGVEFLTLMAQKRGKVKKGGLLDLEASARIVLQDWNGGKIPYFTRPPARKQQHGKHTTASLVDGGLSTAFAVDSVDDAAVLDKVTRASGDDEFMAVDASAPLPMDGINDDDGVDMEDQDDDEEDEEDEGDDMEDDQQPADNQISIEVRSNGKREAKRALNKKREKLVTTVEDRVNTTTAADKKGAEKNRRRLKRRAQEVAVDMEAQQAEPSGADEAYSFDEF